MDNAPPVARHLADHCGEPGPTAWRLNPAQRPAGDPAPGVSVYRYAPTPTRAWWTLATHGMSDEPLPGMPGLRAELLAYAAEPDAWLAELMIELAALPWRRQVALDWGHTISNGGPIAPPPCELSAVLLAPPHFEADPFNGLTVEGDPVRFLFLVPLTAAEAQHQANNGLESLEARFHERGLDYVIRPGRASLV